MSLIATPNGALAKKSLGCEVSNPPDLLYMYSHYYTMMQQCQKPVEDKLRPHPHGSIVPLLSWV